MWTWSRKRKDINPCSIRIGNSYGSMRSITENQQITATTGHSRLNLRYFSKMAFRNTHRCEIPSWNGSRKPSFDIHIARTSRNDNFNEWSETSRDKNNENTEIVRLISPLLKNTRNLTLVIGEKRWITGWRKYRENRRNRLMRLGYTNQDVNFYTRSLKSW